MTLPKEVREGSPSFMNTWHVVAATAYHAYVSTYLASTTAKTTAFVDLPAQMQHAWCVVAYVAADNAPRRDDLELRLAKHAEQIRAGLAEALKPLSDATLAAAQLAEEGPTARLKQNLVAGCYQIRLRAWAEGPGKNTIHKGLHTELAAQALADAEAVLAVLK